LLNIVNSGDSNSGYRNSGDGNSGYRNSGYSNSGDGNSGNYNSGYSNSGNYNSGNYNSGNYNSGYRNSGNYNSGNYNSGDSNSGYSNSGNYNSGNLHTGLFNSKNAEKCYIFNKLLDITELKTVKNSNGYKILNNFKLIKYRIRSSTGKYGDYKYCSYKQSWKIFFSKLTAKQKLEIKRIPHFDSKVFEEITGVKL